MLTTMERIDVLPSRQSPRAEVARPAEWGSAVVTAAPDPDSTAAAQEAARVDVRRLIKAGAISAVVTVGLLFCLSAWAAIIGAILSGVHFLLHLMTAAG